MQLGELLESQQDFAGAAAAYREAAALEPSPELTARAAAAAERARDAALPAPFRAIPTATSLTRGDLAALIGVRLEALLGRAAARQVVMTDVTGHWAAAWITRVARAGVMDPYENHTFQPRETIDRGDLALAVSRLITLAASQRPALKQALAQRPAVADMAPGHLRYPAVAVAVSSGVLPLLDGNRFAVGRAVSGAEAVAAIDRVRALTTAP